METNETDKAIIESANDDVDEIIEREARRQARLEAEADSAYCKAHDC